VTIAGDSEEAKVVEAANKRYTQLLAQRAATDRYTDQEVQTLNPLKKAREVQSSILATSSTGCQAAAWDIADSHTALED
ncbi:WD_REPEATS_REGION domain-containing protein, partial [Haematococcus lacustris]